MRAISPVIATVIIVSVAIAISIAVALWLTGITSGFTQTENLQIVSSYAEAGKYNTTNTTVTIGTKQYVIGNINFNITTPGITLYEYNWSSSKVVAINITNGKLGLSYKDVLNVSKPGWLIKITVKNTGTVAATIDNIFINNIPVGGEKGIVIYNGTSTTINPGGSKTLYIFVYSPFSAGQMVNIKIHTASGRDYPTTITLP